MMKKNSISIVALVFGMALFFAQGFKETGTASYYHNKFHGKKTYSGEVYDKNKMTGAHTTLPMGTMVKVTNLKNDFKKIVREGCKH